MKPLYVTKLSSPARPSNCAHESDSTTLSPQSTVQSTVSSNFTSLVPPLTLLLCRRNDRRCDGRWWAAAAGSSCSPTTAAADTSGTTTGTNATAVTGVWPRRLSNRYSGMSSGGWLAKCSIRSRSSSANIEWPSMLAYAVVVQLLDSCEVIQHLRGPCTGPVHTIVGKVNNLYFILFIWFYRPKVQN